MILSSFCPVLIASSPFVQLLLLRSLITGSFCVDGAMVSGAMPATISRHWLFSAKLLRKVLRHYDAARVEMPRDDEEAATLGFYCRRFLETRFPNYRERIQGTMIGAIDGAVVQIRRSRDNWKQESYYNGKDSIHAVKHLLLIRFDGTYGAARLNARGGEHDAYACSLLNLPRLMAQLDPRFMILGDSAFAVSSRNNRIVRPLSETELNALYRRGDRLNDLAHSAQQLHSVLSAARIASEWGVASLKNVFPGLRLLPADKDAIRLLVFELAMMIHNVRVRKMRVGTTVNSFVKPGERVY